MPQWPGVPVGAQPQQAPPPQYPGIIRGRSDPYKDAAEERARQDQAMQAEQLRIAQQNAALGSQKDMLDIKAKQQKLEQGIGADAVEAERKAAAFLIRALGSNESYENQGLGAPSYIGQTARDIAPNLANYATSEGRQTALTNQDEFIAASLRQDSGAAIPPEELERQRRIYFPMPGDDPGTIEAKRQARIRAIEGLKQSAGRLEGSAEERYNRLMATVNADDEVEGYDAQGNPVGPDYIGELYDKNGAYIEFRSGGTNGPSGGGPAGPGPGDTALSQLGTATAVDLKGVGKAATGLFDIGLEASRGVQRGINYAIGEGGGALLDVFGAPQTADALRAATDRTDTNIANAPTASGALDAMYPTPPGYEAGEFVSTLAGGLAIPGPKAAPRIRAPSTSEVISGNIAREVVKAGKDAGVRVMTTDVVPPKTFLGKIARAGAERIPVAGTSGQRSAQQRERVQAVKDLARDFGADVADDYLDDVAADLVKTRGGQLTTLKKVKDAVIDGVQAPFVGSSSVQVIDQEIARLQGIDGQAFAPVIQRLEGLKANIQSGKTLRQIEGNRQLLGDLFEDSSLASIKGQGQKAVRAVYSALRQDMGEFIKGTAGKEAYTRWAAANDRLAAMAGELEASAFKNVLKKADTTPEQVARLLFNKQPSEVRRLYQNLSPEGQVKARAGLIQLAIEKAGGKDDINAVNPDTFARVIRDHSKAAGVLFEGADYSRLEGLGRLIKYTQRAAEASAAPPTGVQNAPMLSAIGVGSIADLGTTATIFGSYGVLARLYESPATRNLLIGLSKTKPNSEAEGQWIQRILKATATQTERLGNVANDVVSNSPARAAASDNDTR